MPDANTLILVMAASVVLVVVPGPAVIYILTRSISQGRGAGLASAVGVNLGSAIHVLAAVVGLSVVLASSEALFSIVRWAGVAYLGLSLIHISEPTRHDSGSRMTSSA